MAESVAVLDHWHLGKAALGEGEVFTSHLGESKRFPDAIAADSGDAHADILVSEDNRLRKRLSEFSETCVAQDYAEFRVWIRQQA